VEDGRVLKYGMFKNMISNMMEELTEQVSLFAAEFMEVLKVANLDAESDYVVFERFVARPGKGGGEVSEFICTMIGTVGCSAMPVKVWPLLAQTWKSHMLRTYEGCKNAKEKLDMRLLLDPNKARKLTPHEADAIGIALYCIETNLSQDGQLAAQGVNAGVSANNAAAPPPPPQTTMRQAVDTPPEGRKSLPAPRSPAPHHQRPSPIPPQATQLSTHHHPSAATLRATPRSAAAIHPRRSHLR
jgi:hypothetical protein